MYLNTWGKLWMLLRLNALISLYINVCEKKTANGKGQLFEQLQEILGNIFLSGFYYLKS